MHTNESWGLCAVTGGRVSRAGHSIPQGVTVCVPSTPNLLDVAHAGSRSDCSVPVRTLVSRSRCRVSSARVLVACQFLACRPREGSKQSTAAPPRRGSARVIRITRTGSSSQALCGAAAVFQRLRFKVCAVSLRNHHGTAALP